MTNKEKFMEVMNQTFNVGFTIENFRFNPEHYTGPYCSPCGMYKANACRDFTCKGCQKWWNKEYEERK